jgi:hypothetical protein
LKWGLQQSCSFHQTLFQQYVACHLKTCKSRWFPTFNGRDSNLYFDSRPFFSTIIRVVSIQMDNVNPF